MLKSASATALELTKNAIATLLIWLWNAFKACLSALLLLLAWFAAWGAWLQNALGLAAIGVTAFLLVLACAPWVVPRICARGPAQTAAA